MMLSQLAVRMASRRTVGVKKRVTQQLRPLSAIGGRTGHAMPIENARPMPTSHDRATFTVRVCFGLSATS
jgi:hypothetical protein